MTVDLNIPYEMRLQIARMAAEMACEMLRGSEAVQVAADYVPTTGLCDYLLNRIYHSPPVVVTFISRIVLMFNMVRVLYLYLCREMYRIFVSL